MPNDKLASRVASKGGPKLVDMGDGRVIEFPATMSDEMIESWARNEKPTQFEQERDPAKQKGVSGTLGDRLAGIGEKISKIDPGGGRSLLDPKAWYNPDEAKFDPTGPGTIGRQATRPLPPGRNTLGYRMATTASPLVAGLDPEAMERASDVGDTRAVATETAIPLGMLAAGEVAGRTIPGLKGRIDRMKLEAPEKVSLPGGFKLRLNTPAPGAPFERDATALNKVPFAGEEMSSAPFERDATKLNEPYAGEAPETGWNSPLSSRIKPSEVRSNPFGDATSTADPNLPAGGPLPAPTTPQQPFKLTDRVTAKATAKAAKAAEATRGSVARPNDRLVLLPEEAQAEARMQDLATRRASERGMYYAGEMRPPGASNPSLKPAGRVPNQPTPTTTPFQPPLAQRIPPPVDPSLTQRVGYQPSEKAATMSGSQQSLGPEFEAGQREEMISRYKGILRHPQATAEDIAEANARLTELGAQQ